VHDLRRHLGIVPKADLRQVPLQELAAARDVRRRIGGAVPVLGVVQLADVPAVVEERADHAELEELAIDVGRVAARALVAVEQARHRERHVHHVLQVVVLGVAAAVAGVVAEVEPDQVVEGAVQGRRVDVVEGAVDPCDFELHADRVGRVDPVGDVEIAAAETHVRASRTALFFMPFFGGLRLLSMRPLSCGGAF
jgi:hypothetical protein